MLRTTKLALVSLLVAAPLLQHGCYGDVPDDTEDDHATDTASTTMPADARGAAEEVESLARQDLPLNPDTLDATQPVLRRLTAKQYRNTLSDWFGPTLLTPATLEPDSRTEGLYAIGAGIGGLSSLGAEQYFRGAKNVAGQVVELASLRSILVGCDEQADPEGCLNDTLSTWAHRLWRRPITDTEIQRLVSVGQGAIDTLGDFDEGLRYGMMAVLASPHFVYTQSDLADGEVLRPYTGYEMAERLSLFLWASGPDQALLDAAANGELESDEDLRTTVKSMLEDPRARRGLRAFAEDWLGLDGLDLLSKDGELYVHYNSEFGGLAKEETLRLIEHIVFDQDTDFRSLLTTRTTFIDRRLAAVYGVPAGAVDGFAQVELPEDGPRAGLLGHASTLALHATPNRSSPTLRGVFLREHLLCQHMPPPPANVDTTIPEASADAPTMRERLEGHLENEACAGCHALTDLLGLGLERFDGIGAFRNLENNSVIDPSGILDGTEFTDALGLGRALAEHPNLVPCMVETLWSFANGRVVQPREEEQIETITERFAASGHRLLALMEDIALSEGFRHLDPSEASP